jgi:hypothetical protein
MADAVTSAIAREAGLARRALLGLSRTIRIPDPATAPQTRDPGGWGQRALIALRCAAKAADCGASEAG